MFKKLLLSLVAIAAALAINTGAKAADVYQTINVTTGTYPTIGFYPNTLHVCQGDTLHLTIRNSRQGYTRIFMPAFNLDQEIPPDNIAKLDMCIANPIAKNMWFQISSPDAAKVSGNIITNNFQVPVCQMPQRVIDVSVLEPIINYSKEYCYAEKAEPSYRKREPVRGYW